MFSASDLRKGLKIMIDGEPYVVVDFQFSKPGKGQALYRTKLKNMVNGNQFDRTYRSNDKFEKAPLEERTMQFLHLVGEQRLQNRIPMAVPEPSLPNSHSHR